MNTQENNQPIDERNADQVVLNLEKVFDVTNEGVRDKMVAINRTMSDDLHKDDYLPELAKRVLEGLTPNELAFSWAMGIRASKHLTQELMKAKFASMISGGQGGGLASLLANLKSGGDE